MNAEEHLLCCLGEECAEVAQRVSKALRFGLGDVQPGQELTNKERLGQEIADLEALLFMCRQANLIPSAPKFSEIEAKRAKVLKFMTYARTLSTLRDEVPAHATKRTRSTLP